MNITVLMYSDGLYCCATVWLGMGGINYARCVCAFTCVCVCVFDAWWISSAEEGNPLEDCSDYHKHMRNMDPLRLMFHCCGHTHTHTHACTHAHTLSQGDPLIQTVLQKHCRRHRGVSGRVLVLTHAASGKEKASMQDFYFEMTSLL